MSRDAERLRLLVEAGRFEEAVAAAGPVVAAAPDDPEPLCQLARAQLGAGRPQRALDAARRALACDPQSTWAGRLEVLALTRGGVPANALPRAWELTRREPGDWRNWSVLATAAHACGPDHRTEARRATAEALRLAPQEPSLHLSAGQIELDAGNLPTARAAFGRVLALDPDNAAAQNALGTLELRSHNPLRAAGRYLGALRLDPRQQAARQNLDLALLPLLRWVTRALLGLSFAALLATLVGSHDDGAPRTPGRLAAAGVLVASLLMAAAAVRLLRRRLGPAVVARFGRLLLHEQWLRSGTVLHLLAASNLALTVAFPQAQPALFLAVLLLLRAGRGCWLRWLQERW